MIRRCDDRDFELIWSIINDGAQAYKGIIPADRWTEPYMSTQKLRHEIEDGVVFSGYEENGALIGVMGIQPVQDVTLIRHAYVRTGNQKKGIGAKLLSHLQEMASGPVLIGTWADAVWAIRFYEKNGFAMVGAEELGVTQKNVDEMAKSDKPELKRAFGTDGNLGEQLGLTKDWVSRIVKAVGNYGESFDRNVGAGSKLGIARGLNQLWNKGGVQYAPPIR